MSGRVHMAFAGIAVAQITAAILLVLQVPTLTALWPFPGTRESSHVFVASLLMAAGISTGWCLYVGSDRALVGIALDYIVIMAPLAILAFLAASQGGSAHVGLFGAFCLLGLAFGVWLMRWASRRQWQGTLPTPPLVLAAFAVFVVSLVIIGGLLILRTPGVLPWPVTSQLSVVFGWMFLSAAAYFAYGLVERRWENAGGQLAGFLAYDVVLIVPFLTWITSGRPSYYGTSGKGLRLNLLIYTLVVVLSGALAVYYLFIQPTTRIRPRRSLLTRDGRHRP